MEDEKKPGDISNEENSEEMRGEEGKECPFCGIVGIHTVEDCEKGHGGY